jgi:multicomponent Na+:H+ antiporter subunit D
MAIRPGERVALWAPIVLLASLTVVIGLMPEPFIVFAERAANQLVDPSAYVKGVLGGNL